MQVKSFFFGIIMRGIKSKENVLGVGNVKKMGFVKKRGRLGGV